MFIMQVKQLINDEWKHLGDIKKPSYEKAMEEIDRLEEKMTSGDIIFTFRMGVHNLLAVNMNNGPVKFNIQE